MFKTCNLFRFCCQSNQPNDSDSDSEEDDVNRRQQETADDHQASVRRETSERAVKSNLKKINSSSERSSENRSGQSGSVTFDPKSLETNAFPEDQQSSIRNDSVALNIPPDEETQPIASTSSFSVKAVAPSNLSVTIADNLPILPSSSVIPFRLSSNSLPQDFYYYSDIKYMKPLSHFMSQRGSTVSEDVRVSSTSAPPMVSAERPITYDSLIPIATYFDIKVPKKSDPPPPLSSRRLSSSKHRKSSRKYTATRECPPPALPLRLKPNNGQGTSTDGMEV